MMIVLNPSSDNSLIRQKFRGAWRLLGVDTYLEIYQIVLIIYILYWLNVFWKRSIYVLGGNFILIQLDVMKFIAII